MNIWLKAPKVPELSNGTISFTIKGQMVLYNPTQIPWIILQKKSNPKFGIKIKQLMMIANTLMMNKHCLL